MQPQSRGLLSPRVPPGMQGQPTHGFRHVVGKEAGVGGTGLCPSHSAYSSSGRIYFTSSHDLVASCGLCARSLFPGILVKLGRLPDSRIPSPGGQVPQRTGSHILLLWLGPLWPWELGAVPSTPTGSSLGGAWVPGVRGGADDGRCGCQILLRLPGSLWSQGLTRQQATQDQLTQVLHCRETGARCQGGGRVTTPPHPRHRAQARK